MRECRSLSRPIFPNLLLRWPNAWRWPFKSEKSFRWPGDRSRWPKKGLAWPEPISPRVVGEGDLFDLHQSELNGCADIALGFIKLEWNIFEGGKRVAELRVADSKVREAMNQAESIADTIAFQVNQTYRHLATARLGIHRARPAVEQATENYRLVRARAVNGDATPSEITDAATALTCAQQNFLNSKYEYLSAIAKLNYATGAAESMAMARVPQRHL